LKMNWIKIITNSAVSTTLLFSMITPAIAAPPAGYSSYASQGDAAKIPTPKPATPKPVTPTPVTPKPVTSKPVTPNPTTPPTIAPKPVTPIPATPKPVTPTPVMPVPASPKPVTPTPSPTKAPTPVPLPASPAPTPVPTPIKTPTWVATPTSTPFGYSSYAASGDAAKPVQSPTPVPIQTAKPIIQKIVFAIKATEFQGRYFYNYKGDQAYHLATTVPFLEGSTDFLDGVTYGAFKTYMDLLNEMSNTKHGKLFEDDVYVELAEFGINEAKDYAVDKGVDYILDKALNNIIDKASSAGAFATNILKSWVRLGLTSYSNSTDDMIDVINRMNPNLFITNSKELLQAKYLVARSYVENSISDQKIAYLKANLTTNPILMNKKNPEMCVAISQDLINLFIKHRVLN
jgi:hypothetical protein